MTTDRPEGGAALAALLPALEDEHGGLLTAALEAQYVALLDELPTLTLEGIRRRPAQGRATASGLQSQLLELANGSCAAFVDSADCVKRVHEKMTDIANHLAQLETVLPSVGVEADGLLSAATDGIGARTANTLLLDRLTDVLEVLEQPQLMDACVRNGFIDEALELEAAVRARAALHADVPVLAAVAKQVSSYMTELQAQLLQQLSGPLMLPEALRAVGYLRRVGQAGHGAQHALSEPQLRVAYLRSRTAYFDAAEAALPRESPVSYLLKHLELCRAVWYDAVTQYRTLFATDVEAAPLSASAAAQAAPRPFAPHPTTTRRVARPAGAPPEAELALCGDDGAMHVLAPPADAAAPSLSAALPSEGWGGHGHTLEPRGLLGGEALGAALLADWAGDRVAALLRVLGEWLPRVQDGAFLANLLEQSASCATSLGGVGLDFSLLLAAPFRAAILRTLGEGLDAAVEHWRHALALHRWTAPPPEPKPFAAAEPAAAATTAAAEPAAGGGGGDGGDGEARAVSLVPPAALVAHPPLAVLTNHLLQSLNEIRQCAAYELRSDVFLALTRALCAVVGELQRVQATHAFGAAAAAHFASLCASLATHLLPHMAAAADLLVPLHPAATPGGAPPRADGRAERMVAAVLAELQPLLARDEPSAAAPPAAAAELATGASATSGGAVA